MKFVKVLCTLGKQRLSTRFSNEPESLDISTSKAQFLWTR